tara:strand:+ start:43 stop:225 length:183 start_codon:yes stop_codon:yes gene_type:complete
MGNAKKKWNMFDSTATIGRISAGNNTFLMRFPPAISEFADSSKAELNQVHGNKPQNRNNA